VISRDHQQVLSALDDAAHGCLLDDFAVDVDPVRAEEGGEDGLGADCIAKSDGNSPAGNSHMLQQSDNSASPQA
jgi:hypothetical protein